MHLLKLTFLGLMLLLVSEVAVAQEYSSLIDKKIVEAYSEEDKASGKLSWEVTDQHSSDHNGVSHIYIKQTFEGIEIDGAVANFSILKGEVISHGSDFKKNVEKRVSSKVATLTPIDAVKAATDHFGIPNENAQRVIEAKSSTEFLLSKDGVSLEDIPVKLVYAVNDQGFIRISWDLSIYLLDAMHWYSVRVDAVTGDVINYNDWVSHCSFGGKDHDHSVHAKSNSNALPINLSSSSKKKAPDSYNVFQLPIESPNHGPNSLHVNPADLTASPFGWHDTDGSTGAEFTITRGNNVYASEDADADNNPGYSPNGGPTLDFNFPLNLNQDPTGYLDGAITNLFYMNNIMHDVWYHYGFDEASGNFQDNNYGNGGDDDDYVNADAQDGSGTNNANFATPPDGNNPRMQMFIWNNNGAAPTPLLNVATPGNIAGGYLGENALFGPTLAGNPITGDLAIAKDSIGDSIDACQTIINGADLSGKIAIVRRGPCNYTSQVQAAQDEGAIGVIVVNNLLSPPVGMGGFPGSITIPSIMISNPDGLKLIEEIENGGNVNASLVDSFGTNDFDSDLDNGIIAHEYGHGISIRLTGGASNSNCLSNSEQMGEGWSDYFAMVMTIEDGDNGEDSRGVGTYADSQHPLDDGIRPAPYSTDFSINNFTYGATNNTSLSQPHGIGFVWCTVLWDMTWALIDVYGFDPDIYNGTGGNNIAMQLVIDGLKMQPCNPGFVDGRDAIIAADQALYGGANKCLIWEVFANRGLGASADQGSSASRSDQTEAFDLPNICLTAVVPPTADFGVNETSNCSGYFLFSDSSSDIPQAWHWDFGDGDTSNLGKPCSPI